MNHAWVKKIWLILVFILSFGSTLIDSVRAAPDNSRSRVPTAKEVQELLPVVCAGSKINFEARSCTPCPDQIPEFEDSMVFSSIMYGRFLGVGEINAIMDMQGCEAHVNNFGGTMILRWRGLTNWEFIRYEPGVRSGDCLKYPTRAGHDVRVCQTFYGGMGYTIEGFGLYDYTRKSISSDALVTITSNSDQCSEPKLNDFNILKVDRININRDGRLDLRIQVSERHAQLPKAGECSDKLQWGPVKKLTLEFLFDGAKFVPTPATKPLVKYLNGFKA
jgi:hypothetical protein